MNNTIKKCETCEEYQIGYLNPPLDQNDCQGNLNIKNIYIIKIYI